MASNYQYSTASENNQPSKKTDYTKSPYVIKKTAEAKETLTKFPPPVNTGNNRK